MTNSTINSNNNSAAEDAWAAAVRKASYLEPGVPVEFRHPPPAPPSRPVYCWAAGGGDVPAMMVCTNGGSPRRFELPVTPGYAEIRPTSCLEPCAEEASAAAAGAAACAEYEYASLVRKLVVAHKGGGDAGDGDGDGNHASASVSVSDPAVFTAAGVSADANGNDDTNGDATGHYDTACGAAPFIVSYGDGDGDGEDSGYALVEVLPNDDDDGATPHCNTVDGGGGGGGGNTQEGYDGANEQDARAGYNVYELASTPTSSTATATATATAAGPCLPPRNPWQNIPRSRCNAINRRPPSRLHLLCQHYNRKRTTGPQDQPSRAAAASSLGTAAAAAAAASNAAGDDMGFNVYTLASFGRSLSEGALDVFTSTVAAPRPTLAAATATRIPSPTLKKVPSCQRRRRAHPPAVVVDGRIICNRQVARRRSSTPATSANAA